MDKKDKLIWATDTSSRLGLKIFKPFLIQIPGIVITLWMNPWLKTLAQTGVLASGWKSQSPADAGHLRHSVPENRRESHCLSSEKIT